MEYADVESLLSGILTLEFGDRDYELDASAVRLKEEMNARGVLTSTMTLSQLSDFFVAEFKARCDLVAQYAIGKIGAVKPSEDSGRKLLGLYRSASTDQLAKLTAKYDAIASITSSLQSGMLKEIRETMVQRMRNRMQRNDLMIELEHKVATDAKPTEVLVLKPTFYGVGVDLQALWKRYFR